MRILISTPWQAQGLTTLSHYLKATLESLGHEVGLHAWRGQCKPTGLTDDKLVFIGPFQDAADDADCIIWPEVVESEQVMWAKMHNKKTIWIPMWEYVGKEEQWERELFDHVVCPTTCCYELLKSLHVPNAVHIPWFVDYPLHDAREMPPHPTFLHCVRGLSGDIRNTSVLIEAFAKYRAGGGKGHLLVKSIAKAKTFLSASALSTLRQLPARSYKWIAEEWPWHKMTSLYWGADLFIYPTKREGLGLVILEALSNGLPVLTTDAPPMNEWITNGVNGHLIESTEINKKNFIYEHRCKIDSLANLLTICSDRKHVAELKEGRLTGRYDREVAFIAGWTRLLSGTSGEASRIAPLRKSKPVVELLMVTYNRLDFTKQMIASVERNTTVPYRWIIVDNGSTDGTVDWLRQHDWDALCELIPLPANVGKAKAMNMALLASHDAKHICFMDNDILVPHGWLRSMVDLLHAFPEIGATSLCFTKDRHPVSAWPKVKKIRPRPFGALSGAALMFKRAIHKRLGFCDEAFGQYGLFDSEWCFRIRMLGLKLAHPEPLGVHLDEVPGNSTYENDKTRARRKADQLWATRMDGYISGERVLMISTPAHAQKPEVLKG